MATAQQTRPPGFWEERTGWKALKQFLLLEPLPGGSRWTAAFGSLLLFAFALQVITGILLTTNYAPSVETAWPSVRFIQDEVAGGAFIRALHHWGSSAMVILLLVHLVQVFAWGAYKRPRELTWMVGVLLLFCILGLAFTGYLLPWDQKAYWATRVGLGIASTVPLIGDSLRTLLQGGPQMGNLTLTRFFTLHGFVLPGLVAVLVVVHLYLFRLHGVTPSWGKSDAELKAAEEPFWPSQALKDGLFALAFLAALMVWCSYRPAPLEEQANPSRPYQARPEWYFMFLFQMLRYFHGPFEVVGTFVLPAVFFLVLFFWPFLDRSPYRSPFRRPVAMGLLGAGTTCLVGLTIYANAHDVRMHEPELAAGKEPAPPPAGPVQRADVARIYQDNCAACRALDGTGGPVRAGMPTIPDFTSLAWQMSQTDLEITHRIQDGSLPLMPAFGDKLSQAQNLALAIYVRAFGVEPVAVAPKLPAGPGTEPAAPRPAGKPAAPVAAGMSPPQVYRAYCLACHDNDGRGWLVRRAMPEVPDFADAKWQAGHKEDELVHSILEGKGKFMLPMKDKLGPADAKAMAAYLRKFEGGGQVVKTEPKAPVPPPVVAPPVAAGPRPQRPSPETAARIRTAGVLFRQYCLSCHGTDGTGAALRASMPDIPDFTGAGWQESRGNAGLAVSILEGKGTLMPAFRGRVSDDQARDLVAYVRAFGPAPAPVAQAPANDFEERFRQLERQWETLEKQMEEIKRSR